jgi:hypothetical protein
MDFIIGFPENNPEKNTDIYPLIGWPGYVSEKWNPEFHCIGFYQSVVLLSSSVFISESEPRIDPFTNSPFTFMSIPWHILWHRSDLNKWYGHCQSGTKSNHPFFCNKAR